MFSALVAAVIIGVASAQECSSDNTDICGVQIWPFLLDPNTAPSNEAELKESCTSLHEGEKCTRDFVTKCPNVVKKSISDLVLQSFHDTVQDFCTGNLGKRFLTHGECLKKNLAKNYTCNVDAVRDVEAIAVYEPASERLRLTCCLYTRLDKCLSDTATAACDKSASRVVRNLMQSYALFMVDKCLPYLAEIDKCDLSVLKGAKPTSRQAKSFMPALIDIVSVAF